MMETDAEKKETRKDEENISDKENVARPLSYAAVLSKDASSSVTFSSGKNSLSTIPEEGQDVVCVVDPQSAIIEDNIQQSAVRAHSSPHPVLVSVHYSNYPVRVYCPDCDERVLSRVIYKKGEDFWPACIFCGIFCCCLSWIPLTTKIFMDVEHRCSNCDEVIAIVYNRYV